MPRECYDFEARQWVPADRYRGRRRLVQRSDVACPIIISDSTGDALQHPVTGVWTESKSTFRKMTRDTGCVEVGDQAPVTVQDNRPNPRQQKAARVDAIKGALRQNGVDIL